MLNSNSRKESVSGIGACAGNVPIPGRFREETGQNRARWALIFI